MKYREFSLFKPWDLSFIRMQFVYEHMNIYKKCLIDEWLSNIFDKSVIPTKLELRIFETLNNEELTVMCHIFGVKASNIMEKLLETYYKDYTYADIANKIRTEVMPSVSHRDQ